MSEDVTREVDRLLKDRARYQDWLNRLEQQKNQASDQAYGRVRADYKGRLEDVVSRLREHGAALQARLQQITHHAEELRGQRGERSDRLDEARLRRSVGEYTDEREWSELELRLTAAVDEVDKQLAEAHSEIDRLKEILTAVGSAPPKPAEPARPGPETRGGPPPHEARPEAPDSHARHPVAGTPEPRHEPAAPWQEPMVEEHPGMNSAGMVEAEDSESAVDEGFPPGVHRVGEAREPEAAQDDEGFLSLEELILDDEDLTGSESEERGGEGPQERTTEEGAPAPGVGDELAFLESLSLSGGEEKESFSFLEQRGSGSARTIVCPHCSAANDPAEWYCTECGEELPAE